MPTPVQLGVAALVVQALAAAYVYYTKTAAAFSRATLGPAADPAAGSMPLLSLTQLSQAGSGPTAVLGVPAKPTLVGRTVVISARSLGPPSSPR